MKKLRPLFGVLTLSTFLLMGFFVLAQEKKEPQATVTQEFFQAPQKFDRVDRNNNKVLDDLDEQIVGKADSDRFDVIVMTEKPLDEILPALKSRHGDFSEKFKYPSINGFATNLTRGQIIALAGDADIKQIEFDAPVYPHLDTSQQWFGTTKARTDFVGVDGNADGSASYSKNDIVVAVIDTGIDPNHVDLDSGKIIGWKDISNNQTNPYDETGACSGHGTHVSSIIAGEGQGNVAFKGVAPGAALVGVKVLKRQGNSCTGTTSDVIAGIQWVIDNKANFGIEVSNMSLGISGCSNGTDSTSVAANAAVDAGIVMTVSAGNEGPGKCTIGSPAAAEKAITVGAMADVTPMSSSVNFNCGQAPNKGFYLACFSSRGPTADGRIKPDVSAPGVFINAVAAGTTNGYKELSGTSMSSPFTAGVVALMLDASPSLTSVQIKSTIGSTAFDWGPTGKDVDYGSGRLQGYEAVKSAGGFSGSGPSVPFHSFTADSLSSSNTEDFWNINVTDTSLPLAVTMIMPDWTGSSQPDFDIQLLNPANSVIAQSLGINRQETVGVQPTNTGTYKLRVFRFAGSGNYFFDQSAGTGVAVAITLTTDGTTPFGILALGVAKDTTSSGTNDTQTVQITTGPANLSVKSTNFANGNIWNLGATNGANQVKWEFSKDALAWATFSAANFLFTLDTNVTGGNTRDLYLRLTMPTSTSSSNEHSATVTIVATAP